MSTSLAGDSAIPADDRAAADVRRPALGLRSLYIIYVIGRKLYGRYSSMAP